MANRYKCMKKCDKLYSPGSDKHMLCVERCMKTGEVAKKEDQRSKDIKAGIYKT